MSETETIKLTVNSKRYPVTVKRDNGRMFFGFGYNKPLQLEIKALEGAKYHGYDEVNPRKIWSAPITQRNNFQLAFLQQPSDSVPDPYSIYDNLLITEWVPEERYHHGKKKSFKIYYHQRDMAAHIVQRSNPGCVILAEMGTGKSLSAILAMEHLGGNWWYVAPKSALAAVKRELTVWGCKIRPHMLTYEGLTKEMKNWVAGNKCPTGVVFDESSKLKNLTSQRSQSALALANGIREDWGKDGHVILMTGSPAPKSPVDFYSQCEIACPGFLKEGTEWKFKETLAIVIKKEDDTGGSYPHLVTWKDNELKCADCGQFENQGDHNEITAGSKYHTFKKSVNEVARLYKRMKGLAVVLFKKDCLSLPEKTYRIIEIEPSATVKRAAGLITKASRTTIQGLTLLRELSDGFRYTDTPDGLETCKLCQGSKEIEQPEEIEGTCENCKKIEKGLEADTIPLENNYGGVTQICGNHTPKITKAIRECPNCNGEGEVVRFIRTTEEVSCPKDDVLSDLLDEHEDIGRLVIFAGFTGSLDRVQRVCQRNDWAIIRLDQGKIVIQDAKGTSIAEKDYQSMFQDWKERFPRVAFIAHPGSGGMGLTLTASPTIVYYSNTFNFEERVQSEDRIHRPGMDENRGATIVDIVHLESDRKVLINLKMKHDLQAMSLGDMQNIMAEGKPIDR